MGRGPGPGKSAHGPPAPLTLRDRKEVGTAGRSTLVWEPLHLADLSLRALSRAVELMTHGLLGGPSPASPHSLLSFMCSNVGSQCE